MIVYDYLINNFEVNKPIYLNEIIIEGISNVNLRKQVSRLLQQNKIAKYSQGIYYLPKETSLGKSTLLFDDVITSKYITNGNDIFGFYSGLSFYNKLGISTQVPFTFEIVTNKEVSRKRMVTINNRNVILKNAYTSINKDNVLEMQLLDFINSASNEDIADNYDILKSYIKNNKLRKEVVMELLIYFPAKTSKKLIEGKLLSEFI